MEISIREWNDRIPSSAFQTSNPYISFFLGVKAGMGLASLTLEMPILAARGQGRGWKAGSAGGEDLMKGHFPYA